MAIQVESGPPASARPTGTVTFLFSDIEGSTSRWENARDAMALARHDALMRAALEAHGDVFAGYRLALREIGNRTRRTCDAIRA